MTERQAARVNKFVAQLGVVPRMNTLLIINPSEATKPLVVVFFAQKGWHWFFIYLTKSEK